MKITWVYYNGKMQKKKIKTTGNIFNKIRN